MTAPFEEQVEMLDRIALREEHPQDHTVVIHSSRMARGGMSAMAMTLALTAGATQSELFGSGVAPGGWREQPDRKRPKAERDKRRKAKAARKKNRRR